MKYCTHCGKQLLDAAVLCPGCGCSTALANTKLDKPIASLNVLSFLIPLVGLILHIIYIEKTPKKAAAIGKWAIVGVATSVLFMAIQLALI